MTVLERTRPDICETVPTPSITFLLMDLEMLVIDEIELTDASHMALNDQDDDAAITKVCSGFDKIKIKIKKIFF